MKTLYKTLGIILASLIFLSCQKKPVPPVISTTTATEISTVSAVSGGNITNDGGAPIISKGICWNTTTDPTIAHSKTSENGESLSFTSNITQLIPSTLYYVRAYATNSAGTSYGKSESFKTLGDKPESNSQNASNIQLNSATLNGNINPNSLSTVVTFEYGITTNYGSSITAVQSPLTGNLPANVSVDLTGLTAGTTYHFRIKAENSLGITYSSDLTFKTLGQLPTVTTLPVSNLQIYTSTLNGSVNANYLSTTTSFEWGTTTSYGNTVTPSQSPVTGSTAVNVNTILTGLTPGTTYHFKIKATNELGTSNSNDMPFTTLGQVPSVTTLATNNITVSTATLNGSVNPNYLPTTFYFEWGTDNSFGNQVTPNQNSLDGGTPVTVSVVLSGLTEGTKYYYRITATNELGTTTTNSLTSSFTTLAKPIITTKDISEITTTSALSGGNVISDFGSPVFESGVCWSTSNNPTTTGTKVLNTSGNANFNVPVTSLTPNSVYYLRAYAINSVGIGYGNEIILKTYTGTISDNDGNQYYTVTIDNQLWMAENLKVTKYNDGTAIANLISGDDWHNTSGSAYCWYNNDINNKPIYGAIYNWHTLDLISNGSKNVCPINWHVPTYSEWTTLINYLGSSLAGGKLKEIGTTHWNFPNTGANNSTGFTAVPGGGRGSIFGEFVLFGNNGEYWTSSTSGNQYQSYSIAYNSNELTLWHAGSMNWGHSIRCIKD